MCILVPVPKEKKTVEFYQCLSRTKYQEIKYPNEQETKKNIRSTKHLVD